MELIQEIKYLREKKNAVLLAHNYQPDEIQDIADYTGDSLELARIAAGTNADIIVFCGVHFMAESAVLLSPDKKVLLPDTTAGCPMADMATEKDVAAMRNQYPGAAVVTYINSSATVKALSDVCCTSANAVKIVQRIEADTILFFPDRNLGSYVQRFTGKKVIPWKGYCPTHERFTVEELNIVKSEHPDAVVMVHPECRPEIIDCADEVQSTGGMVNFAKTTRNKKIIIGTEMGMLHRLKAEAPDKEFILASPGFICGDMKKITLEKIRNSLADEMSIITVDPDVADRAKGCLQKMLELSY
ncbi:MAG TPA: quinolinate synthase NadA [Spirochaetota bacterium]|nr:quinolinate synthase NadA [Spirochaetota bacterium]